MREAFAYGRAQQLFLLAEPTNPQTKNAVRVIGNYKGLFFASRAELGYVPTDVAEALTETGHRVQRWLSPVLRHHVHPKRCLRGIADFGCNTFQAVLNFR